MNINFYQGQSPTMQSQLTGGIPDSGVDTAQGLPTIDLKKVKPFIPTSVPDHYLDEEPISPLVKWDEKDEM